VQTLESARAVAVGERLAVRSYAPSDAARWDAFVRAAKNGTFLFTRGYMDHHASRFRDASSLVFDRERLVALVPANRDGDELASHSGLTYGGVVVGPDMTTPKFVRVFQSLAEAWRRAGVRRVKYKTVPSIYHRLPAEEDRHALFLAGAELVRRDVLSVLDLSARPKLEERRRRGQRRAERAGIVVAPSDDLRGFWRVLRENLAHRHGVSPVHDEVEIELLRQRFPREIRLYAAHAGPRMVAGVVVYHTGPVAHAQYIASTRAGREQGALDACFAWLFRELASEAAFFDFGSSSEQDGRLLNAGLVEYKEGFGARTVVHDFYDWRLA